jgi:hypothetical protein
VDGQVLTVDIGASAVTAAKIKDGEVKAADIATDAVGAAEIAANAVGAAEIATNAVGAAEIASFAVGAEEIGADSVGASELVGVTELDFEKCVFPAGETLNGPGGLKVLICNVPSADTDDTLVGTLNGLDSCTHLSSLRVPSDGQVYVSIFNSCAFPAQLGGKSVGLIVFDKVVDSKT